jgi:hypothetical protein
MFSDMSLADSPNWQDAGIGQGTEQDSEIREMLVIDRRFLTPGPDSVPLPYGQTFMEEL